MNSPYICFPLSSRSIVCLFCLVVFLFNSVAVLAFTEKTYHFLVNDINTQVAVSAYRNTQTAYYYDDEDIEGAVQSGVPRNGIIVGFSFRVLDEKGTLPTNFHIVEALLSSEYGGWDMTTSKSKDASNHYDRRGYHIVFRGGPEWPYGTMVRARLKINISGNVYDIEVIKLPLSKVD